MTPQAQLTKAVQMNDPARVISREIALKNIYLDQHGDHGPMTAPDHGPITA